MSRRFRRRPSARSLLAGGLLLLICTRVVWDCCTERAVWPYTLPADSWRIAEGPCSIEQIIDGDTLLVRPSRQTTDRAVPLRLLAIECPQAASFSRAEQAWSEQAADFTRRFIAQGPTRLRLDRRRLDRHDRCLAYLFVRDTMLNLELVRAGLARVKPYPGDSSSIAAQLIRAEDEARNERRGIWSRAVENRGNQ